MSANDFIPNSFQTPNIYVDRFMAFLTDAELRVLVYTVRRIFGFQKRQDRISLSQYTDGLTGANGEKLDYGCGITSRAAVGQALKNLVEFGLMAEISKNDPQRNEGAEWALQLDSNQVNIAALLARYEDQKARQKSRTEKARQKRAVQPAEPVSGTNQVAVSGTNQDPVSGTNHPRSVGQTTPGQSDKPPLVSGTNPQYTSLNPDRNPERKPGGGRGSALPPQAQVFEESGGKWPSGRLKDGTSKKDRAIAFMVERIPDDPESLSFWGEVVEAYSLVWSPRSYTVMVNDYFLEGRLPGGRRSARKSSAPSIKRPQQNEHTPEQILAMLEGAPAS